ncbi:hypothetical protein A1OW_20335 [Enterovibrio norvegicus]|uniref:hypothetical protein n=1 Tax=Enterovibrio norvegicus TaxID=188144 RepID=UPI0002DE9922|nr:hypothetical protein [Enterovibrio norvegicus]OEF61222.1 hypothetical protein A1OW_20335 [Enterovibrio norvegicus]
MPMKVREKAKIFDEICRLHGVNPENGNHIATNVENCIKFADKLHAIEREYFMEEGEPDEDFPDDEVDLQCMLNSWGEDTETYVKNFGIALNKIYQYDKLIEKNQELEKALVEEIDNRDSWEERATKLALAVGEHFDSDVGEHSSCNCPINNAHELLNQI